MMSSVDDNGASDLRRTRREFIWVNHPDRGGDEETFVAGLAKLEAQRAGAHRQAQESGVTIYRRRRGIPAIMHAAMRWYQRRTAPPRVR
jgi:hypothetical protein